jgi:hypothetical protein
VEPLSTFTFSKPPAEMTDEELEEMADRILDQWAKDLADDPDSTQIET